MSHFLKRRKIKGKVFLALPMSGIVLVALPVITLLNRHVNPSRKYYCSHFMDEDMKA